MTFDRRVLSLGFAASAIAMRPAMAATTAPTLGEDGLYRFDWYLESFLDLGDDLATAARNGKRLAVMWGLRGCPFCKQMHEVHLRDPAIVDYIKTHFEILHLDQIGARETTDFDGGKIAEKSLGQRYGVRFTPTIQFFPQSADGLAAKRPPDREVARMPGLLEPPAFLAMFKFVVEKGYESSSFTDWLKKRGV